MLDTVNGNYSQNSLSRDDILGLDTLDLRYIDLSSCGFCSLKESSLLAALSKDRGPILSIKSAFDRKTHSAMVVFFADYVYFGCSLYDKKDHEKAFVLINRYMSEHDYYENLKFSSFFTNNKYYNEIMLKKEVSAGDIIPETPPNNEYWPGKRNTKEDVPDFVLRVWGEYIPYGLRISHFKTRDPKLWIAINNHRTRDLRWPDELRAISQRDQLKDNERLLLRGELESMTPKQIVAAARKLARLQNG